MYRQLFIHLCVFHIIISTCYAITQLLCQLLKGFLMACRYNVSANASSIPNYIIPRTAIPNPKVTAYLNGTLVWGSEPSLVGFPAQLPLNPTARTQ